MQRVFGEPGSPWLAPRFAEIVDPVRRLAEAFSPRVVFTRFVAPAVPHGAWRRYYDQWPFALQPPDAPIYELADPFAAMAGPTLDATTFSKWGPEPGGQGRRWDRWCWPGCPPTAACCPPPWRRPTPGSTVRVVADACAGVDDESHAQALHIMSLYGPLVEVVTVADVLGGARPA